MDRYGRPAVAITLVACSGAVYYFVVGGYCSLEWKDIVNIIVGALVANLTTVVQYYFGSSQGSNQKTENAAEVARGLVKALNGKKIEEAL